VARRAKISPPALYPAHGWEPPLVTSMSCWPLTSGGPVRVSTRKEGASDSGENWALAGSKLKGCHCATSLRCTRCNLRSVVKELFATYLGRSRRRGGKCRREGLDAKQLRQVIAGVVAAWARTRGALRGRIVEIHLIEITEDEAPPGAVHPPGTV